MSHLEVLRAFVRRLFAIVRLAWSSDVIIIEKEAFPYFPAIAERLVQMGGAATIYDYDDAIWHSYEARRFGPLTGPLRSKISRVVAKADHVIVGSRYLKEQVEAWGAPDVSLIPTTVPATVYQGSGQTTEKTADLVWIGSMSTGPYLFEVFPVIEQLHKERGSTIRLIGFPGSLFGGDIPPYAEVCEWSAETELDLLAAGRIGIMPLPDSPYERGKCGFKLIQYMGLGLPVVASAVGENRFIVEDGASGYVVNSTDEWYERISALLESPGMAAEMGAQGYRRFLDHYSTESAARKLLLTIDGVAEANRKNRAHSLRKGKEP